MTLSKNAKKAFLLGGLCSAAYLAVYVARNVLSAVTPQMVELGYTEAYIGSISSLYFVFYAVGQLINGAIGDKITAKWMICLGLGLAGIANFVLPYFMMSKYIAMLTYSVSGFFLSMIYGPMTKVVSENTEPLHAVRCSIGYTFASLLGSPLAGILATFLAWEAVFSVSSITLVAMACVCFISFSTFERLGVVKYNQYKKEETGAKNVKALLEKSIIKFSFVAILTGIVRTSVVFWLPTYIAQHLGFSSQSAAAIFTVASFAISFTTIITIFIYEKTGKNMNGSLLGMFVVSFVCFVLTYFVSMPVFNIIFIVLAIMSADGAASILWGIYCPSLRDTGMVSSATGFLDFLSYMAAAAANLLFANSVSTIGWRNLILVWCALGLVSIFVALPWKRSKSA